MKGEKGGVEDKTLFTKGGEQRDDAEKQPPTNHWIPSLEEDGLLT